MDLMIKKAVEQASRTIAKVPIKLDRTVFSLFTGHGQLYGLEIGNPMGYRAPYALRAAESSVILKTTSLLSDTIIVKSIHLQAPEIMLEGDLAHNNLRAILANIKSNLEKEVSPASNNSSTRADKTLQINELQVSHATLKLYLSELGSEEKTIQLPDIRLTDQGKTHPGMPTSQLILGVAQALVDAMLHAAENARIRLAKTGNAGQDHLPAPVIANMNPPKPAD